MRFGALGDVHGDFGTVRRILGRHPDVPFWLSVGDLADDEGRYESFGAPIYWIKGNNESFDAIASGRFDATLIHVPNGQVVEVPLRQVGDTARTRGGGHRSLLRIAGLGGTFAPTWYETPATDLPHPVKSTRKATERADKRRHFVREEVEACLAFRGIDVFLTHEAPSPFRAFPGGRGPDAGKTVITEILAAVQPRLHLFGHHHRFTEQTIAGVRSVGLDLVSRSYLLIDPDALGYHVVSTTATDA
jgi:uncharacterized protein